MAGECSLLWEESSSLDDVLWILTTHEGLSNAKLLKWVVGGRRATLRHRHAIMTMQSL